MSTKANSNSDRSSWWSFRFHVDDDGWCARRTGKAEAVSHQHVGRVGLVCKLVFCDALPSLDGSDSKIRIPQDSKEAVAAGTELSGSLEEAFPTVPTGGLQPQISPPRVSPNALLSVCHPLYFGGDKFPACIGFSAVLSLLSRSSLSAPRLFARSI